MAESLLRLKSCTLFALVCLIAVFGLMAAPANQAQALEDLPTVTENDLASGKVNGKNWMSGISGTLPLHQITIPGTHDSGMSNTGSRTQLGDFAVLTLLATEVGKRWAKTQDLDIDEQLDVGVRMFDIRITDTKPDTMSKGDGGLWVCHGKNIAGRALSFVYYPKVASGKRTGGEEYLTFDKVMRYCTDFLSKHPTETIMLQVNREQGSGDDAVIWQRANDITGKWASAVNPSTGKSYIYKQSDTGNDWHITSMPKLEDVRGQIVLVTPDVKSYNYGMCLDTINGWSIYGNVAGMSMAFENHYEVDRSTKADYVQAFYGGDSTEKGEKFPYAQEGKIDSKLPYNNIDHVVYVNTSSNGFTTANGSPVHIADYVNDVLFTIDDEDGPFFDDTRGSFLGWLNVDFVTEQIAKKIWISNYPKGGLEYTKITFKPGEGVGDEKTYNVQRGTEVRLPQCMYSAPEGSGLSFQGWDVERMTQYGLQQPGQTFSATENSYWIVAKFTQTWRSIARVIAKAPQSQETVIDLRNDITATDLDRALTIDSGKKIVINLNGHTINRNMTSQNSDISGGSAIISRGSLTINGPGTITGGSAMRGGGIYARSGDVTLKDVTIEKNCASVDGGGVYVYSKDCSFTVSGNTKINFNYETAHSTGLNAVLSNVCLGPEALVKGLDSLAEGAIIAVTTEVIPTRQSPVVVTDSLGSNAANLLKYLKSDREYGIELSDKSEAMLTRPYRVTFSTNGAGEVKTQLLKAGEKAKEPTVEKTGYHFLGWFEGSSDTPYDFDQPVNRDINLVARWKAGTRTVTFDSSGGSSVPSQTVDYGTLAKRPENPTREGYDFAGWKVNYGDRLMHNWLVYNFDEPVIKDITVKAGWQKKTYTVTFRDINGDVLGTQKVKYEEKATRIANPAREGSWFDSWCVYSPTSPDPSLSPNPVRYNFDSPVTDNLVLVTLWKKIPSYKVTFQPHGDNVKDLPTDQWIVHGQAATEPTNNPTREGYTFKGWHRSALYGGGRYDFNQPVFGEVNLYAQWEASTHTVTFDGNAEGDTVTNMPAVQTVKHDELATKPQYWPRRTGYEFKGWYLNDSPYTFGEGVTGDITLKAKWDIMSYLVFFRGNATGVTGLPEYIEVNYNKRVTDVASVPTPTRAGYDFGGWYTDATCTDGNKFDFNTPIVHSREVFAKWTVQSHEVTFNSASGSSVADQVVAHGGKAEKPKDPTRDGYVFAGWYQGNTPYDFDAVVTSNVALTAQWEKVQTGSWAVVFDSYGGTDVEAVSVEDGDMVPLPSDPTRYGYTFAGWYTYEGYETGDSYDFGTPVTSHLVLYAKWTPQQHTVTFDGNGGSGVASQRVDHDSQATEPEPPTKDNCVFAGWYAGDAPYDFYAPVTGDVDLRAHWIAVPHTVRFDSAGGSDVPSQSVDDGRQAHRPDDPTREGYAFAGWYAGDGDDPYDFEDEVTDDLTLTAHWETPIWSVLFNDQIGEWAYDAQTVEGGEKANRPDPDPSLEGYDFEGWFRDEGLTEPYDFETPVNDNLVLFAKWKQKEYVVTFDSTGGSAVDDQPVKHGGKATKPEGPTKDGHTFSGWYRDGEAFDFDNDKITGDVTLTAYWTPIEYEVYFDVDGGAPAPEKQDVAYGAHATQPEEPQKANYRFDGWFVDVEVTDPITAEEAAEIRDDPEASSYLWLVDKEGGGYTARVEFSFEDDLIGAPTTLHARWANALHTVSFDANGGTGAPESQLVEHSGKANAPSESPIKEGYLFTGWYTDKACSDDALFDFDRAIVEDTVLHAGWEPKEHLVTFVGGGDESDDDQLVKHNGKANRPDPDPSLEGYDFVGWFEDEGLTEPYDFETSVTDDIVLYAKWQPKMYTVTFDADGGSPAPDAQRQAYGSTATEPTEDPVKENCSFGGWYIEASDEALDDETIQEISNDSELSREYWATDDKHVRIPYDFGYLIEGDITLHARWQPATCVVTFDAGGGTPKPNGQTVDYGSLVNEPSAPAKPGFDFKGWWVLMEEDLDNEIADAIRHDPDLDNRYWVTDNNSLRAPFEFSSQAVYEDTTLYARWATKEVAVTFVDEEGNVFATQSVRSGDKPIAIDGDNVEGFSFDGWYADSGYSAAYDFGKPITADTTVYGKWSPLLLTVTFDSNGGNPMKPQSQQVAYAGLAEKPADPVWEGHAFIGWYGDLSDEITPEELDQLKAEIRELSGSEEADPEMVAAFEQVLQELEEDIMVRDGKVMVSYDPQADPVYSDLTVLAQWSEGSLSTEIVLGEGAPKVEAANLDEVARLVFTDDEVGQGALLRLVVNPVDPSDVAKADKSALEAKRDELGADERMWLDISLYKVIGDVEEKLESTPEPLKLTMEVPEDSRANGRTFHLVRGHGGKADVLASGKQTALSFETAVFSPYLLVSTDASQGDDSEKQNQDKGSTAKSATPRTGDEIPTGLVVLLGLACLASAATLTVSLRRRG